MAETSVTIKLKPAEYDLLRKAVKDRSFQAGYEHENNPNSKERAEARQLKAQLDMLLARL